MILSDLNAGDYAYTITVENQSEIQKGNFKFVNFDVELQFSYADIAKLRQLSHRSKGEVQTLENADLLIDTLLNNEGFTPIQKTFKKNESLIEWKWLLGLIMLSLSIEWFVRKYKGLI